METQKLPPQKRPYKNGIDHAARARAQFAPRSWSFLWRAKVEAAVAIGVIAGVVGVFVYLVQIPGALVVRLMDDKRLPVAKAHVRCRHQGTGLEMAGDTDLFGEAKFPGLERGPWTCAVQPPDRFFSLVLTGVGSVEPRHPAIVELAAPRGAELEVAVARPDGAPRAAVAVRAVCDSAPPLGWEARTGLLDAAALLYVPRGASCRVGMLPGDARVLEGKPPALQLDCARLPCTEPFTAAPGERRQLALKPTAEQWQLARPPPEPDQKAKPEEKAAKPEEKAAKAPDKK